MLGIFSEKEEGLEKLSMDLDSTRVLLEDTVVQHQG